MNLKQIPRKTTRERSGVIDRSIKNHDLRFVQYMPTGKYGIANLQLYGSRPLRRQDENAIAAHHRCVKMQTFLHPVEQEWMLSSFLR
jgi:hypothetical protein